MKKFMVEVDLLFAFGGRYRRGDIVLGDHWAKLGKDVKELPENVELVVMQELVPPAAPAVPVDEPTDKAEPSEADPAPKKKRGKKQQ